MPRDFKAEALAARKLAQEQERQARNYHDTRQLKVPPMQRPEGMASDSEAWRHLTECRHILYGLPNRERRRWWLADIERIRGKAARERIEKTMRELWQKGEQ